MNWQDKIVEYMQETHDFLLENAPAFFQEIITYGRAKSIFLLIGIPVSILLCVWLICRSIKKMCDTDNDMYMAPIIACMLGMVILVIVFFQSFEEGMMSWFAPKLYILKQIKS